MDGGFVTSVDVLKRRLERKMGAGAATVTAVEGDEGIAVGVRKPRPAGAAAAPTAAPAAAPPAAAAPTCVPTTATVLPKWDVTLTAKELECVKYGVIARLEDVICGLREPAASVGSAFAAAAVAQAPSGPPLCGLEEHEGHLVRRLEMVAQAGADASTAAGSGSLLLVGPTGVGKTETLARAIRRVTDNRAREWHVEQAARRKRSQRGPLAAAAAAAAAGTTPRRGGGGTGAALGGDGAFDSSSSGSGSSSSSSSSAAAASGPPQPFKLIWLEGSRQSDDAGALRHIIEQLGVNDGEELIKAKAAVAAAAAARLAADIAASTATAAGAGAGGGLASTPAAAAASTSPAPASSLRGVASPLSPSPLERVAQDIMMMAAGGAAAGLTVLTGAGPRAAAAAAAAAAGAAHLPLAAAGGATRGAAAGSHQYPSLGGDSTVLDAGDVTAAVGKAGPASAGADATSPPPPPPQLPAAAGTSLVAGGAGDAELGQGANAITTTGDGVSGHKRSRTELQEAGLLPSSLFSSAAAAINAAAPQPQPSAGDRDDDDDDVVVPVMGALSGAPASAASPYPTLEGLLPCPLPIAAPEDDPPMGGAGGGAKAAGGRGRADSGGNEDGDATSDNEGEEDDDSDGDAAVASEFRSAAEYEYCTRVYHVMRKFEWALQYACDMRAPEHKGDRKMRLRLRTLRSALEIALRPAIEESVHPYVRQTFCIWRLLVIHNPSCLLLPSWQALQAELEDREVAFRAATTIDQRRRVASWHYLDAVNRKGDRDPEEAGMLALAGVDEARVSELLVDLNSKIRTKPLFAPAAAAAGASTGSGSDSDDSRDDLDDDEEDNEQAPARGGESADAPDASGPLAADAGGPMMPDAAGDVAMTSAAGAPPTAPPPPPPDPAVVKMAALEALALPMATIPPADARAEYRSMIDKAVVRFEWALFHVNLSFTTGNLRAREKQQTFAMVWALSKACGEAYAQARHVFVKDTYRIWRTIILCNPGCLLTGKCDVFKAAMEEREAQFRACQTVAERWQCVHTPFTDRDTDVAHLSGVDVPVLDPQRALRKAMKPPAAADDLVTVVAAEASDPPAVEGSGAVGTAASGTFGEMDADEVAVADGQTGVVVDGQTGGVAAADTATASATGMVDAHDAAGLTRQVYCADCVLLRGLEIAVAGAPVFPAVSAALEVDQRRTAFAADFCRRSRDSAAAWDASATRPPYLRIRRSALKSTVGAAHARDLCDAAAALAAERQRMPTATVGAAVTSAAPIQFPCTGRCVTPDGALLELALDLAVIQVQEGYAGSAGPWREVRPLSAADRYAAVAQAVAGELVHEPTDWSAMPDEDDPMLAVGYAGDGRDDMGAPHDGAALSAMAASGGDFSVDGLHAEAASAPASARSAGVAPAASTKRPPRAAAAAAAVLAQRETDGGKQAAAFVAEHVNQLRFMLETVAAAQLPLVIVIDNFDVFARSSKQMLLYNLLEVANDVNARVFIIGLTTRHDSVDLLEKRLKSRFGPRQLAFPPLSPSIAFAALQRCLSFPVQQVAAANLLSQRTLLYALYWQKAVDAFLRDVRLRLIHSVNARATMRTLCQRVLRAAHLLEPTRFLLMTSSLLAPEEVGIDNGGMVLSEFMPATTSAESVIAYHPSFTRLLPLTRTGMVHVVLLATMAHAELRHQAAAGASDGGAGGATSSSAAAPAAVSDATVALSSAISKLAAESGALYTFRTILHEYNSQMSGSGGSFAATQLSNAAGAASGGGGVGRTGGGAASAASSTSPDGRIGPPEYRGPTLSEDVAMVAFEELVDMGLVRLYSRSRVAAAAEGGTQGLGAEMSAFGLGSAMTQSAGAHVAGPGAVIVAGRRAEDVEERQQRSYMGCRLMHDPQELLDFVKAMGWKAMQLPHEVYQWAVNGGRIVAEM